MNNILNEEAKTLYLHLSIISFDYGFISYFELASRLRYLSLITKDEELKKWLNQFWELSEDADSEEYDSENIDDRSGYEEAEGNFLIRDTGQSQSTDEAPILAYLTSVNGVLGSKWRFHQYDKDHFPSIPHGHLVTKNKIKLDCYRGFTYDTSAKNKPLHRERRKFIVNLWNDDKFRVFAINQINFYIVNFPNYKWRVRNPLRIPRKRP